MLTTICKAFSGCFKGVQLCTSLKLASYNLSVAMFRGKPRNSRLRYNSQLENEEMNTEDWLPCSRPWLSINVLFVAHDEFMMHSKHSLVVCDARVNCSP